MKIYTLCIITVTILLTGCASNSTYWTHPFDYPMNHEYIEEYASKHGSKTGGVVYNSLPKTVRITTYHNGRMIRKTYHID